MTVRHFLTLLDLGAEELRALLTRATALKTLQRQAEHRLFKDKILGMIFEKSSTRTRVSFEAAILQLGGHAIFLSPRDAQLGRGEPIEDTARVLSRMVDIITIRTYGHSKLERFAESSTVPVINALTDREHPCQLLADMQTYWEHRGDIQGKKVTWFGDGNNMCHSYLHAAQLLGFELAIACPEGYEPEIEILNSAKKYAYVTHKPLVAANNADLVVTDVWASMGQEKEHITRRGIFAPYQVNREIMARAKPNALFMHCLPAHRGEEVSTEVLESHQSAVWDEAENRLHSQKALLELLLSY